jgi:cyclomaltodextrinase
LSPAARSAGAGAVNDGPAIRPPEWVAGRTWYQVHALRALGAPDANPAPHADVATDHRLRGLEPWLDHIADLGAGGLLLTPVFASLTHGYDTVDPFRVDQRLGDDADLVWLVGACHDRDLRLLLDGVFNHVSRAFGPFAEVLEQGPNADAARWFRIDAEADGPDGFGYDTFEGHSHLVALDHDADEVVDWAVAVACHWLDRGIDGWRLDAAYAVPTAFWSRFSQRVLERFGDAYLVGEVIHGDYATFVRDAGLHAVTQYELHKAIWSALHDRNPHELSWSLGRHADFVQTFVPHTFVGNHDVTRLRTRIGDPALVGHALAVLCSVPGTPGVYYGDEFGAEGSKEERAGGDDAIRPAFADLPAAGDDPAGLVRLHRDLLGLRRARPWLDTGELEVLDVSDAHLRYRVSAGDRSVTAILNVGDEPVEVGDGGHAIAGHGVGTEPASVPAGAWALLE